MMFQCLWICASIISQIRAKSIGMEKWFIVSLPIIKKLPAMIIAEEPHRRMDLGDLAGFHVEALLARLAHRERLARQRAVEDDGLEQIGLAHAGQVKACIARLASPAG